jgi:hypothetical protein
VIGLAQLSNVQHFDCQARFSGLNNLREIQDWLFFQTTEQYTYSSIPHLMKSSGIRIPDEQTANIIDQERLPMGHYTPNEPFLSCWESEFVATLAGAPRLSRTDSSFASLDWLLVGSPP